jgi:hypothetical protein
LNQSKAIAVVASKNVAPTSSTSGVQRSTNSVITVAGIGRPSTTMRSRKSTRWGDVNFPT